MQVNKNLVKFKLTFVQVQTKKMCSQICIRLKWKNVLLIEWSEKLPPECGLDLRGYDQFLYYFCTFLRNRHPSWRITKWKKKMKMASNQNIPSGIKFKFWVNCHQYASCIHMPAGAGYPYRSYLEKLVSITIPIQRQTGSPFVSLF